MKALDYPQEEIDNTLIALKDAGFITAQIDMSNNHIYQLTVSLITYNGYQFIEVIRPKPVWERIKAALCQVGSGTLEIMKAAGTEIIKSETSAYLKENPQV